MEMKEIDKIMILLKNRAIYEMCIEDIRIWEDGKKSILLYPSYTRFPECFDFVSHSRLDSKKERIRFENIIKNINKSVKGIVSSKAFKIEFLNKRYQYPSTEFLQKRKKALDEHLSRLRLMRRLNNEKESSQSDKGK